LPDEAYVAKAMVLFRHNFHLDRAAEDVNSMVFLHLKRNII